MTSEEKAAIFKKASPEVRRLILDEMDRYHELQVKYSDLQDKLIGALNVIADYEAV